MNEKIKNNMLKAEQHLQAFAYKSECATRLKDEVDDIRPSFFRGTDRILHTDSYTRYANKTQVFSNIENDNISRRFIHVQLVSKIARTIGRALNLNEDLIEAISLSHDLGHVPFGHTGEKILNQLSKSYGEGCFKHNIQSARILMNLENHGEGLNISVEVLDGVICHNGEFVENKYCPKHKTTEDFLEDYKNSYIYDDYDKKLVPMTLEGCVVRISDVIAYIGRDIEDACKLGIIKKEDVPKSITDVLGDTNKKIVNTIVMDIINNSIDKNYIKMTPIIYEALNKLKDFNYKNIYNKANTLEKVKEYELMFKTIFEYCLKQLRENNKESRIYKIFLNDMSSEYKKNNSNERIVIDYIAGMTDDYFLKEYDLIIKDNN